MKLAATQAIAGVVGDDELHAEYIIPSVFNREVVKAVALAVARAAEASGVARRPAAPAARRPESRSAKRSRHVSLAAAQRKRTPSTGPKLRSRDPLARFNREIGRRIDVVAIFPRRRLVDPAGLDARDRGR